MQFTGTKETNGLGRWGWRKERRPSVQLRGMKIVRIEGFAAGTDQTNVLLSSMGASASVRGIVNTVRNERSNQSWVNRWRTKDGRLNGGEKKLRPRDDGTRLNATRKNDSCREKFESSFSKVDLYRLLLFNESFVYKKTNTGLKSVGPGIVVPC